MSLLMLLCVQVNAQQRFVVIDMETKVPLRDVRVRWGAGREIATAWDGSCLMDTTAIRCSAERDSAEVHIHLTKPGYLERNMLLSQLTDTIELLPSFNKLTEVVVWGKKREKNTISFTLKMPTKEDIGLAKGAAGSGVNVDIMGGIENLLTHKKRKFRKKVKENLAGY